MKALIDPRFDRVCQIEENDFPVAEPLFWTECPDDITTQWTYVDGEFLPYIPQPEQPLE